MEYEITKVLYVEIAFGILEAFDLKIEMNMKVVIIYSYSFKMVVVLKTFSCLRKALTMNTSEGIALSC